jgi:hypothetical protein
MFNYCNYRKERIVLFLGNESLNLFSIPPKYQRIIFLPFLVSLFLSIQNYNY